MFPSRHLARPVLLALALAAMPALAAPRPHAATEPGDRLIVKLRDAPADSDSQAVEARIKALRGASGVPVSRLHGLGHGMQVLRLDRVRPAAELDAAVAELRKDPRVESAEVDHRVRAHSYTPGDPLFTDQWFLQSIHPAAVRATNAWDIQRGGPSPSASNVVIAVLDTGVRFDHPDLRRAAAGGKLLPGFDFVSADSANVFATANDGDGWDADPSDPGDWLSAAELARSPFEGRSCGGGSKQDQPTASTWHGTRVAGLIAADTDNGIGVAGAAFNALILPVRVLGKCGGYDSDVIAAMYWSAGLSIPLPLVSGTPIVNSHPAKVINLSLGSVGSCNDMYATAVRDLTAKGVVVVASAGNEGGPVDTPANCSGVLAVGGLRHVGSKVGYSNLGPEVGVMAPAGNCGSSAANSPCLYSLMTTTDLGSRAPVGPTYTDPFNANLGTSFSAPLAAATVGLMQATNPNLTITQLIGRMKSSALPFPRTSDSSPQPPTCHVPADSKDIQDSECLCTTAVCGAGMLDMGAAVRDARRPIAIAGSSGAVGAGKSITIDGSASLAAAGRSVARFAWTVASTSGGAGVPSIAAPTAATTTVMSPTVGSYTLRLTITDDQGFSDTADVTVQATSSGGGVTSTSPPPSSGGGGRIGIELIALAMFASLRRARMRRADRP
jgi:serine protease